MADIKQAAKWMNKDKDVRRKSEPLEIFSRSTHFDGAVFESRCDAIASFARMTTEQLLANDWELAD